MTRTSTVKFLDELSFSAKAYSGSGLYHRIQITATNTASSEAGDVTALVGSDVIVVPVTPVTKSCTISYGGQSHTFAAGTPIGMGVRLSGVSGVTVGTPTVVYATGDILVFDVLVDYDAVSGTEYELEYIDSKSGSTPEFTRAIKEKGVIRHRKRNLDPERTLSIAQKYQSRTEGLMALAGREYILKVSRMDDNFLVETEVDYFYQCYHNAPEPSGSSGAQDSTVSFEIMYERRVSVA